jgi:flavin-dependent dehydrogenase
MTLDAEIGVVGAGPAGARAAELLAQAGAEVILWDPKAPWEKPCGGGLTASAFRTVPELREILPRSGRTLRVRLDNGAGARLELDLEEPFFIVPRIELARWQLERARAAGATLISQAVRGLERSDRGWRVTSGDGRTWTVRRIVGSDGAASLVRCVVAPNLRIHLSPTRVAFVPGLGATPDTATIRFFRGVVGYLWEFSRPDHRSIGIGVWNEGWRRPELDREIARYWTSVEEGAGNGATWAGAAVGSALKPHARGFVGLGGPDFALLGDAAGFADPAFGEGIQNALRSAALLREAYDDGKSFASYPGRAFGCLEPEFRRYRLVKRYLLNGEVPDRLIRGALRNPGIFALIHALVNWENLHEPTLRLPWRWMTAFGGLTGSADAAWAARGRPGEIGRVCG